MTSPAQLAANRANARRSTGPRTAGGKARARLNAVTHGAYARVLVLAREDRSAFDSLHAGFIEAFRPVGRYEAALVERLSLIWWRIQRAVEAEAMVLEATGYDDGRLSLDAKQHIRLLDRIGAVEHRLQQAFERFHAILERRQGMRRRRAKRPDVPPSPSCAGATRASTTFDAAETKTWMPGSSPGMTIDHWLRFVGKTWNAIESIPWRERIGALMHPIPHLRGPPEPGFSPGDADFLFRLAKTGWVLFAMGRQGVKLTAD